MFSLMTMIPFVGAVRRPDALSFIKECDWSMDIFKAPLKVKCEGCGNEYFVPSDREPKMDTPCWECGFNICEITWTFVREAFRRTKGEK